MFSGPFDSSIIKRAQVQHHIDISYTNLRDFSDDTYKSVDDHPYGGGIGMILRVDVIDKAISHIKNSYPSQKCLVILLDPQGKPYKQSVARTLTTYDHLILVCAHYEGIDERIRGLVDMELSIGDYVVTGGEIPAMVIVDSVTRLLPGVLKHAEATQNESFNESELEHPHYTRPPEYKGLRVPDILLSGNHEEIDRWRKQEAKTRTAKRRPDLLTEKTDPASSGR